MSAIWCWLKMKATHGVEGLGPVIVVVLVGGDLGLECSVDFEWQVLAAHATGTASAETSARHVVGDVGVGVFGEWAKVVKLMKSSEVVVAGWWWLMSRC